jgi:hypothetical protein
MLAAGLAVFRERLAQALARPVEPDGEIVARHPQLIGHHADFAALEIHRIQQFAVLLREVREQPFETLAEHAFIGWQRVFGKFLLKTLQGAPAGVGATIYVNDRATQDAVKPGDGVLFLGGLPSGRHRFEQTFLHDVLSQVSIR